MDARSLIWLAVMLQACGQARDSRDESTLPVVRHLLEAQPVSISSSSVSESLEAHTRKDKLWVHEHVASVKAWRPDQTVAQVEFIKLPLPIAGSPLVHSRSPLVTSADWRRLKRKSEWPLEGELVLSDRRLLRRVEPANDSETVFDFPITGDTLRDLAGIRDGTGAPAPQELRLAEECRSARVLASPHEIVYQVDVPELAHLDFAVAVRRTLIKPTSRGLRVRGARDLRPHLSVRVELEDGTLETLWERTLEFSGLERFHEVSLDLNRWSGETVRLHFAGSEAGAVSGSVIGETTPPEWAWFTAWAEPVVWSRRRTTRPNIIFLMLDTLRADRLGAYGWERARTPHLDQLAATGVRFSDAMSAASWTLPAHASLFTSSYASQHGLVRGERLSESMRTVAEVLRSSGYRTGAFTEGGYVSEQYGFARGFELFQSRVRECEETFDLAANWIEKQNGPFFAFLHTYKVHSPYDPAPEVRADMVREYSGDLPRDVTISSKVFGRSEIAPAADDVRYVSDLYDAEIAELDKAIGDLLGRLEDEGALSNTLIVVTSDHGEEFYEHGGASHGHSLYQEQLHIPLILNWQGHFDGGRVANHPVHLVDLAPTLTLAAGVEDPEQWVGVALGLEPPETARPLFAPMRTRRQGQYGEQDAMSLRQGQLKYIDMSPGASRFEKEGGVSLFDLSTDPEERHDLLDQDSAEAWALEVERLLGVYSPLESAGEVDVRVDSLKELEQLGYIGDEEEPPR